MTWALTGRRFVRPAVLLMILLLAPRARTSPTERTTVITMWKVAGGLECKVGPRSYDNLLSAFQSVHRQDNLDDPVAVLIDDRLPISHIWVAPLLANKVPLTNVRVFVLNWESASMFEIKRAPSVPLGTRIE
jgi:hypothetical protein